METTTAATEVNNSSETEKPHRNFTTSTRQSQLQLASLDPIDSRIHSSRNSPEPSQTDLQGHYVSDSVVIHHPYRLDPDYCLNTLGMIQRRNPHIHDVLYLLWLKKFNYILHAIANSFNGFDIGEISLL